MIQTCTLPNPSQHPTLPPKMTIVNVLLKSTRMYMCTHLFNTKRHCAFQSNLLHVVTVVYYQTCMDSTYSLYNLTWTHLLCIYTCTMYIILPESEEEVTPLFSVSFSPIVQCWNWLPECVVDVLLVLDTVAIVTPIPFLSCCLPD